MSLAHRRRGIVAPANDPIPFPGRVSVVELYLYDRPGRAYFFEPTEEAGFAILIGFDFDKQDRSSRLVVAEADSNAMRALKCKGPSGDPAGAFALLR